MKNKPAPTLSPEQINTIETETAIGKDIKVKRNKNGEIVLQDITPRQIKYNAVANGRQ